MSFKDYICAAGRMFFIGVVLSGIVYSALSMARLCYETISPRKNEVSLSVIEIERDADRSALEKKANGG